MTKKMLIAGILLASGPACSATGAHWGYSGAEGPENWSHLSPDYAACSGKNQSPIDLKGLIEADLEPIQIAYRPGGNEILNNGHTVQVSYAPGSTIVVDGDEFELKQFHFHTPSENNIDGKSFPMEAHLVHADKNGNLAVIAVMIEEGEANDALAAAWAQMPKNEGDEHEIADALSVEDILPKSRNYYRFNGSLTTPPCTEGVRWLVMKEPISASNEQIQRFADVLHHPNNRPVQPVNARTVLK